ncbi:MAG: hypothetical protein AAFP04_10380 [Myxococcota bacterium]
MGRFNTRLAKLCWLATIGVVSSAGCGSDVQVEESAVIACTDDAQCPDRWVCVDSTQLCSPIEIAEVIPETAPVTAIEDFDVTRRYLRSVDFDLELIDVNGSTEDPEEIVLEFEYIIDEVRSSSTPREPEWWPGTIIYEEPWMVESATPQTEEITWNLLADFDAPDRDPDFESVLVDTSGEETLDRVAIFIPSMRLRTRAVDRTGQRSAWVETPPFSLGNQVPVVHGVRVVGENPSGPVPIEIELSDSSRDEVSIDVFFRILPEVGFRRAEIISGEREKVVTSTEPKAYVLVWDSAAASRVDSSLGQGIGPQQAEVELRVRATDSPIDGEVHHSPWSALTVTVDNN